MASLPDGIERVIFEGVLGIFSYALILNLFEKFEIPFAFIFANIIMIILLVILVSKMNYWSIPYTAGWIIGLVFFGKYFFGLLGLVVCIVAGVVFLCIKFKNKFRIYKF